MSESDLMMREALSRLVDTYEVDVEAHLQNVLYPSDQEGSKRPIARFGVTALALAVASAGFVFAFWAFRAEKTQEGPPTERNVGGGSEGGLIAFTVESPGGYDYDIWVMNADGSEARPLVATADREGDPVFSPEGTKIAFVRSPAPVKSGNTTIISGGSDIFVINADGTGLRQLTADPPEDERSDDLPAWSPDGTKIAFRSNRGEAINIWVMNADGSDQRQLTHGTSDHDPAWSPDGTKVAFVGFPPNASVEDDLEIYVIGEDGWGIERLTDNVGYDGDPAWSPDGAKIAFKRSDRSDYEWDIWTMNANGTGQRRLTDHPGFDGCPVWSPRGTEIAFASDRDATPEEVDYNVGNQAGASGLALYIMRSDGTGVRMIKDEVTCAGSWIEGNS